METDLDEFTDYASEAPLPTPRGTPYDRTPMLSRHPSRGQSPNISGSPIPPPDRRRMSSQIHDGAFDETISILDPRRFTPTLHANLVAEILSLRRELESKNGLVETLESELDTTRAEHENANEAVATALKEARDAKRQLARAEKDDAMAVVAQERDEAVQTVADLKKQLERIAKARRAAEEDLEQLRKTHERDSEKFEEAKRGFERRAHVAEGRLKAVLDEIAAARASAMSPPPAPPTMAHHPSHQRVMSEDYGDFHGGSDTRSIRSSTLSIDGRPSSLMMGDDEAERLGISLHGNSGGLSLADELNFDQSEDEGTGTEREQTDAEPEDMVSDTESVEDVDELPELADMGIQCEPEINYEERALELEDLLEERAVELERVYNTIQQKTEEMDVLYSELDTAHNRAFDLEEKLDFLNTQGIKMDREHDARVEEFKGEVKVFHAAEKEKEQQFAARSLELDVRSSELDVRAVELDVRSSELEDKSSELDSRSIELDVRAAELDEQAAGLEERKTELESMYAELEAREMELRHEADVMREINEDRSASLDDREIELEDRERVLSAEEAEIKELKEWVDQELNLIKEGKEEAIAMVVKEEDLAPRTTDAYTEPTFLTYISTATEPESVVFISTGIDAPKEPEPLVYVSAATDAPKAIEYISTATDAEAVVYASKAIDAPKEPEPPVYASTASDAFGEPHPKVYVSTASDAFTTKVYTSTASDAYEYFKPRVYTSAATDTITETPAKEYTSTATDAEPVAYMSTASDAYEDPYPKLFVSTATDAPTVPPPPVCISTEAQTLEEPMVSTEAQTSEEPMVSTEAQTADLMVSTESQTLEKVMVSIESQTAIIYASAEVQTVEESVVFASAAMQTEEEEKPEPIVYASAEVQAMEEPMAYISMESQTTEESQPIVVSAEMQTNGLPSPPATPLLEKPKLLMQSAGIQTDAVRPPKPTILRVPAIMVSPPEPTPPLPKPAMRNASAQTRPQRMRTRSMQTQQIGLDERLRKFAPHLLPSALLPKAPVPAPVEVEPTPPESPVAISRRSSKRTVRRSVTAPIPAPSEAEPGTHDMGAGTMPIYSSPKTDDEVYLTRTTSRKGMASKNLFNNIHLSQDNEVGSSGDDGFPEEGDSGSEYKTALSAPKPRGARRNTPALKLNMPMAVADADIPRRQASVRRGAMVASGVAAHSRVRSPSLTSNRTTESGGTTATKIGPPFPVPARHSSKRPGYLSDRDRATPSPTGSHKLKRGSSSRPKPPRPQSIRKIRSAIALPSSRDGTRSPPPLSTSSNAPSSPGLPPPLPRDEISSPAFDRRGFGQSRHRHQGSNNTQNTQNTHNTNNTNNTNNTLNTSTTVTTSNPGQVSGGTVQQTSVVDAIAQTMVGEWMWKYVRRRRSFGVSDATPQGDDSAGGQRHKRWVWLAPYERAVMWSSRQPTSGSALLGKSGRKRKRSILHPFGGPDGYPSIMDKVLTKKVLIQSVLDVKDDTPLPKGATQPVFNRSILILTPARALKFTAPSRERHYVWLTALSFLSHSAESNDGLLALPPPMPFEYDQVDRRQNLHPAPPPVPPAAPARLNAFSATRDSVRLAKGKGRASPVASNGYPSPNGSGALASGLLNPGMASTETLSAEPPTIPRFPGTSRRRRSNSNLHRPQTRGGYEKSLESYSTSNAGSTNGDSFRPDSFYGVGGVGLPSPSSSFGRGDYVGNASGGSGWDTGPVGTVRMEAFIDRQTPQYDDYDVDMSSRPDNYHVKRDRRASRHEAYWGRGAGFYGAPEDFWRGGDDPFRGF